MKQHRLWYQSSYDRGLEILLAMWPAIKEKYPDAELWICYGWETFDSAFKDNPERQAWKKKFEQKMNQPGIRHLGRLGKEKLKEMRDQCGIWAYPTFFQEINCIGALEAQESGCVPVTMDSFALSETVQSGIKVKGDIYDPDVKAEYLKQLLDMMGDEERWTLERLKGKEFVQNYSWDKIADEWLRVIE